MMLSQMSIKTCFILFFISQVVAEKLQENNIMGFQRLQIFTHFPIFFLGNQTVEDIRLNENKIKMVREVIVKTFPFEISS